MDIHFQSNPEESDVLVHLRISTVTDDDGKTYLLVDEIQKICWNIVSLSINHFPEI